MFLFLLLLLFSSSSYIAPAAAIPSWAQARTEMDLKADANYAARGGVEQTTTMKTKRAQQYVNFERLLFSSKRRKAKRTPAKTCAVRRLDYDDDDDNNNNDDDDEIQRETLEWRRTTKQLGVVIVVCLENMSALLKDIDCETTNVYVYVKCAQHLAYEEAVEEKMRCVTVIHSKLTRRPNSKMHVEWFGHIVWKYDEALEQSLMFLKGAYKNKGKSDLDWQAWLNVLQSQKKTKEMDFSFTCLMEKSQFFPTRSEHLDEFTEGRDLLCSMYERYTCEKNVCKNFLGCTHSMFASSSERIRSLPRAEYLHLFDFLMNEGSDYHIYSLEKVWSVILGCAKTYGEYSTSKNIPLRVRCGRGEYGTFDIARVLPSWWQEFFTKNGTKKKSPAVTITPCENRTKHFHDSWFPCGLW